MTVTFWGTRGSGAAAGRDYVEFGGDTSCVSVEWGSQLAVFDAGTGIGRLGEALAGRGFSGELHLFLSHFHLDHICGLPLSGLVFCPGGAAPYLWNGCGSGSRAVMHKPGAVAALLAGGAGWLQGKCDLA